jgi:hypothetical protein
LVDLSLVEEGLGWVEIGGSEGWIVGVESMKSLEQELDLSHTKRLYNHVPLPPVADFHCPNNHFLL